MPSTWITAGDLFLNLEFQTYQNGNSFSNSKMAATAIINFWNFAFPNRSLNVFTNFVDDRSNSKEMATVYRNSRWRRPPSWILPNIHFRRHRCVLKQTSNIPFKYDVDLSLSNEMATVIRNQRPPAWIIPNIYFRHNRYIPNQSPDVSTYFGDNGSNTKAIPAVFRNPG